MTAEDKSHIPLQPVRPLVLRTIFQDEDALTDNLDLAKELDELFRDATSRGRDCPLVFVDAREMPGAYQVAGRYSTQGQQVTVTVRLALPHETGDKFTVVGDKSNLPELAKKIYAEVQQRLTAENSSH